MPFDSELAPFIDDSPFPIDQKSTPFYPSDLLAIPVFHLHHTVELANCFISIGNQLKRKFKLALKIFMRFDAVAGDSQNVSVKALKFRVKIAEVLAFLGSAGGIVPGVKVKNDITVPKIT